MSAYQEFEKGGIKIRYFPDTKVIVLGRNPKMEDKIGLLKRQLETFLSINSVKTQNNSISLQLSDNSIVDVAGALKAMGASGGEEIENAASVAKKPAEEDARESEKQTAEQQPSSMSPGSPQMPPEPPGMGQGAGMPLMAGKRPSAFEILYEGVFGGKTFPKGKKPARRTGKYWVPIESVLGKNRAKITQQDILRKRRDYSRKPDTEDRNKVLRALDKAFNYFYGILDRDVGHSAAEKLAEDYYSIDNLNPKDYKLTKSKAKPIGEDEEDFTQFSLNNSDDAVGDEEMNGPNFADFADVFDDEETDSYDDIEIEEDVF